PPAVVIKLDIIILGNIQNRVAFLNIKCEGSFCFIFKMKNDLSHCNAKVSPGGGKFQVSSSKIQMTFPDHPCPPYLPTFSIPLPRFPSDKTGNNDQNREKRRQPAKVIPRFCIKCFTSNLMNIHFQSILHPPFRLSKYLTARVDK